MRREPRGEERWWDARFVARPNRFVVRARLDDGRTVDAHLGDPGRLRELLAPDARLRLREEDPETDRRTRFTVALVRSGRRGGVWVSLEPARANRLAHDLLTRGAVRGLPRPVRIHREVRHGSGRLDFALDSGDGTVWVEVKSVTRVDGGIARFPDAPTTRGTRHLRDLTAIVRDGGRAAVLFVVPRADARLVVPWPAIDPAFAAALADARGAGVLLRAWRFRIDRVAGATPLAPVPVWLRGVAESGESASDRRRRNRF